MKSTCPAYADFRRDPLTVALYALTDMEYPLLGPIRIKNFDHFLVDAYQQMQARGEPAIVGYGK